MYVLYPWLAVLAALIGLCLGSFYNVCIHRYLTGGSIVFPASHCPHCQRPLNALELIPVASWLVLRGRCRTCRGPISARYPTVELISGLWALLAFLQTGPSLAWLVLMAFGGIYIVASFIDFASFILPDVLTIPAALLAFPAAVWILGLPWQASLWGGLAGSGMFYLLHLGYWAIRRREGLGLGDVKLMLSIGALVGWQGLPVVILTASITALAAAVFFLRASRKAQGIEESPGEPDGDEAGFDDEGPASLGQVPIPFGPFLSFGAMVTLLYGPKVWLWYGHVAGWR